MTFTSQTWRVYRRSLRRMDRWNCWQNRGKIVEIGRYWRTCWGSDTTHQAGYIHGLTDWENSFYSSKITRFEFIKYSEAHVWHFSAKNLAKKSHSGKTLRDILVHLSLCDIFTVMEVLWAVWSHLNTDFTSKPVLVECVIFRSDQSWCRHPTGF